MGAGRGQIRDWEYALTTHLRKERHTMGMRGISQVSAGLAAGLLAIAGRGQEARLDLSPQMVVNEAPFGTLSLVDEIDCAADGETRGMLESHPRTSRVATILGRSCRVLPPVQGSASYFSFRIGRMKLLRPGGFYVLSVEYPEDAPRSMVIINTGNETARGFHTGGTLGDAFHSKYVNNLAESIDVPLSRRWETWNLMLRLHDRYPERGLVRGGKQRPLTPEQGFDVTLAQFSARNAPLSAGIAAARIRLYEIVGPDELAQPLRFPPDGLPRRHLFWREEMADGLLGAKSTKAQDRGLNERLDWYRFKADLMSFLGMNTFSKDLLEFGACQHWDSTPHGGHAWVYFDPVTKELWGQIVKLMGERGLTILPYYEYSGSKGQKGLGNQRRCRPLTRDDAYTHIKWVESASADITDPDTHEDFRKMLDCTVVRHRRHAQFVGAWLRTRSQMPISFSESTLGRFAADTNRDAPITRKTIRADRALYAQYIAWWQGKRRDFFTAMRDYLRSNGVADAMLLYTGCPSEPGVGFHTWEPLMVTDRPERWAALLKQPGHLTDKKQVIKSLTVAEVVRRDLYLEGLTSPALTWGGYEVQHARPADDPLTYADVPGVLLTHAFNRLYTVASPRTFDAYRGVSGLAAVRHHSLNENMMFDKHDKDILGYFVADIERAGPYCMMAEAVAVANGDPTMIGYLAGCNFGRGFPSYVRRFNANFLALPALPSTVVADAAGDPEVVVRVIATPGDGKWFALVNTGKRGKEAVQVRLPGAETVRHAVTDEPVQLHNGAASADFYPFELKTWRAW